jgi:hypothetical protein
MTENDILIINEGGRDLNNVTWFSSKEDTWP